MALSTDIRSHSSRARTSSDKAFSLKVASRTFDEIHIGLSGKIRMDNASQLRKEVLDIIESEPLRNIVIDLGEVEYFDSSGVAVLIEGHRRCKELDNSLRLVNLAPRIKSLLELVDFEHYQTAGILRPRTEPNLLVQIGEGTQDLYQTTQDILTFIGAAVVALAQDIAHPFSVKWDRLGKLVERSGSDAIPIVAVLSFLMGAVMAFQSAIQLRKFGANIFVADLVSLSICVEMGPLMTALIVAGRSGAGYAAHIGTMQVTEEVDALRVMLIDPIRYLVSPRILAVAISLPCLTLIADIVGILGGCVVAVLSLDLTPAAYFNQVGKVLELTDIMKGLTKSLAFGIEVATIGCLKGFQVRGGAESVGTATTSAVVTSIFIIVLTDAVITMIFHYTRFM
ncbi:MAG: MlaE family lipid ABC transporter permease subunit [Deltaproteobacteria bacterium]